MVRWYETEPIISPTKTLLPQELDNGIASKDLCAQELAEAERHKRNQMTEIYSSADLRSTDYRSSAFLKLDVCTENEY